MRNLRIATLAAWITAVGAVGLSGCSDYKESGGMTEAEQRQSRIERAENAIAEFKQADPSISEFFKSSAGYVVFPSVAKGAAGVGAARGKGVVYEDGNVVGYATLTQGTIGFQLGGQSYREIIFFQTPAQVSTFKNDDFAFSAQASAVAATKGAAANADYADGVAVFTMEKGGLMFEASVGGQKFNFTPAP